MLNSRAISMKSKLSNLIHFEVLNNKGIITLNRPQKLNVFKFDMANDMLRKLIEWENKVEMVIIKGEGRSFCAGTDLISIVKQGVLQHKEIMKYIKMLYSLEAMISVYKVPYIALIDGITMGTGAGLSAHGKIRIGTERTQFAMPETKIGFTPDNGISNILSRMPHQLGMYLGLTGDSLKGTDVVKIGIATHYIRSENIPTILKGLVELNEPKKHLNDFVLKNTEDVTNAEFSLQPHLETIERAFSAPTVEEIIFRLEKDRSEFALNCVKILKKASPLSLKITKKFIEMNKNLSVIECLTIDNRLSSAATGARISTDFYEGVRAKLIDKDENPKWSPSTLEEVTEDLVEKAFEKLPLEELNFPESINKLRTEIQSTSTDN